MESHGIFVCEMGNQVPSVSPILRYVWNLPGSGPRNSESASGSGQVKGAVSGSIASTLSGRQGLGLRKHLGSVSGSCVIPAGKLLALDHSAA